MKHDKIGSATNLADCGMIERRGSSRKRSAVANYDHALGIHALCEDAVAHVIAQHDDSRSSAQSCTVEAFPKGNPTSRTDNVAAESHVWVKVTDVIDKRNALHSSDHRADDAVKGWVGHGKNEVGLDKHGARNSQSGVGKIVGHAAAHLMTRIGGGAHTLDCEIARDAATKKSKRIAFVWIVRWTPSQNGDLVALGQGIGDHCGDFRGRGSIRGKIFVEQ